LKNIGWKDFRVMLYLHRTIHKINAKIQGFKLCMPILM